MWIPHARVVSILVGDVPRTVSDHARHTSRGERAVSDLETVGVCGRMDLAQAEFIQAEYREAHYESISMWGQ